MYRDEENLDIEKLESEDCIETSEKSEESNIEVISVNHEIKDSYRSLNTANRKIKDSVFTDLFKDKGNLRKLYATFYEDESKYKDEDFKILTLSPVLANTVYNDLGFMVGNRLIVLVEEQSSYNPNMPIRMLIYAAYTYQKYIFENELNIYASNRIKIPSADFIVLHTFDATVEQGQDMKLSDSYIEKESEDEIRLELKVRAAGKEIKKRSIVYEYIMFCQIYTEEIKGAATNADKLAAVRRSIKYCKEHNILRDYLEKKEAEVAKMMMSLFTQEEITDMFIKEAKNEGISMGRSEGISEGISIGRNEGISMGRTEGLREGRISTAQKMLDKGMSLEEIQEMTDLSIEDIKALKA